MAYILFFDSKQNKTLFSLKQTLCKSSSGSSRFYSQPTDMSKGEFAAAKLIGDTKHYPPANKEWRNSVYAYNKNSLRSLAAKDSIAKRLIKGYFSLSMEKTIARSKRMRSLIRKSTAKKLFISSPEIKQTNDKVIITVYTFDREKQFLLRKLYFRIIRWEKSKTIKQLNKQKIFHSKPFKKYDHWRKKDTLARPNSIKMNKRYKIYINRNERQFNPNKIGYKYSPLVKRASRLKSIKRLMKRRYLMFIKKRIKKINKKVPYSGAKLYNQMNFSYYVLKKKREFFKAKCLMQYSYLTDVLSSMGIRISYLEGTETTNKKNLRKLNKEDFEIIKSLNFKQSQASYNLSKLKAVKDTSLKRKVNNIIIRKKVPYYVKRSLKHVMAISSDNLNYIMMYKGNDYKKAIKLKNPSIHNLNLYLYYLVKTIFNQAGSSYVNNNDLTSPILNKTSFEDYSQRYFLDTFFKSSFYVKPGKDIEKSVLDKSLSKFKNEVNEEKKKSLLAKYRINLSKFKESNPFRISRDKINKQQLIENFKNYNTDVLTINSMFKLLVNRFKFDKFLTGLKVLMSRIYNKKIELNIVNLKSPHLNTDIFTQAVAIKLKKRVGLLRVMRRSLQLVKLPYRFKSATKIFNFNRLETLNLYRSLKLKNLNNIINTDKIKNSNNIDNLQAILKTLYYRTLVNEPKNTKGKLLNRAPENKKRDSMLGKVMSVLNNIKYKWATGVRLQAAGRLTRRYTAARSAFKFRHKGSLKNKDYSRKLDFMNNSMSNVLLRNSVKSNLQHSFLKSKKRIGAFGLKTWISTY